MQNNGLQLSHKMPSSMGIGVATLVPGPCVFQAAPKEAMALVGAAQQQLGVAEACDTGTHGLGLRVRV